LSNVVAVAAGFYFASALKADGTIVCWGTADAGETNVPAGLNNAVGLANGWLHCVALRADGTVVSWGLNNYGQTDVPAGLANVVAVAAGPYHSLALRANGTVVAWGNNGSGQTDVPASLGPARAIAGGGSYSLALQTDGTLVTWSPPNVLTIPDIAAIAAGTGHNLVLKSNGTVVAWGDNRSGQSTVPDGLSGVAAIAAGHSHSLALITNTPPVAVARLFSRTLLSRDGSSYIVLVRGDGSARVNLDGSLSSDADGDVLQYSWSDTITGNEIGRGSVLSMTFAVGTYSIQLTVSDSLAADSAILELNVITPPQAIDELIEMVAESSLPQGDKSRLIRALRAAAESFEQHGARALISDLKVFKSKVRAQVAPKDPALAAQLTQYIDALIAALSPEIVR
jgi:hypothetical protein